MNLTGLKSYLLFIILASCGTITQPNTLSSGTKIKEIILVNGGTIGRCQMGELINSLSKCNPKVIGINFLFIGEKDAKCDSVLKQSIITSDKVILVEGYEHGKHVESDRMFSDPAMLTGLTGLSQSKNELTNYYYRVSGHQRWEYSFPMHLALQYDTSRQRELAAKSYPKDYPINFYHKLNEFQTIDHADVLKNRDLFNGKMVLIGYLGPGDENIFKTPVTAHSSDKTFGTVIIANIVLDILKDLE